MRRVLITGMSGTGKSVLVAELQARGERAVDLDCDEYSEWVTPDPGVPGTPVEAGRDWVWRGDRVAELLDRDDGEVLFVSGCAANMGRFVDRFDRVVLLSAPVEVLAERLRARASGYGSRPEQVERVRGLIEAVEPVLRRVADVELDASAPLEEVVAAVLDLR